MCLGRVPSFSLGFPRAVYHTSLLETSHVIHNNLIWHLSYPPFDYFCCCPVSIWGLTLFSSNCPCCHLHWTCLTPLFCYYQVRASFTAVDIWNNLQYLCLPTLIAYKCNLRTYPYFLTSMILVFVSYFTLCIFN